MGVNRLVPVMAFLMMALLPQAGSLAPVARAAIVEPELAQRYTLEATFEPSSATLTGELTVAWTNTTGEPQASLPFRLYPNADHYGEGQLQIDAVTVDGAEALGEVLESDATVIRVPFPRVADPDARREVSIAFTTTVPVDSTGSFGIFRGNSDDASWSLVNWYPIVAGWEAGEGWYLDGPAGGVDPTFVTASMWDVTVHHPDSLTVVATGEEHTSRNDDGGRSTTVDLPVGREFAMVMMPADGVVTSSTASDGQSVVVTLPEEHAIPELLDALEAFAGEALPRYAEWFDLPLDGELDLTFADLDGALGVSWSGAIWLDLEPLVADGEVSEAERESLRFVVYHEIAHQWMANIIGTNSNDHTFLTEGVSNVLAVAVVRDVDGPEAAERAFLGGVAGPYRAFVNGGQDAVANTPIGELSSVVHSFVTYGKGGLGFEAIRQHVGDEAFYSALAGVGDHHAWEIVSPEMLLNAFERSSGEELDPIWDFWFEQEGTSLADVDAVISAAGD